MGTTRLRPLLTSLCSNSCWNYAVLWRLRHGDPISLTWEDGYFHYPKPRGSVEASPPNVSCDIGTETLSSPQERNNANGIPGGCPIGLLVSQMSHLQYVLGEGVVGKLASTGGHYWVSFKDFFLAEVNLKLVPECPDEWLLQFASGIKTILLVSILPCGVLQLGSMKEVTEDIDVVTSVRDHFNDLDNSCESTSGPALKGTLQARSPSSLISYCIDHKDGQAVTIDSCRKLEEDTNSLLNLTSVKLGKDSMPALDAAAAVLPHLDEFGQCGKSLLEALEYENKTDINPFSVGSLANSYHCEYDQLEVMENKLFELSCLMEELQGYSGCNNSVFGELEDPSCSFLDSPSTIGTPEKLFRGQDDADTNSSILKNYLTFPADSELHKALGPAFREQASDKIWNQSLRIQDANAGSSLICKKEPCDDTEASWLPRGADMEYLLEAVVANAFNGSFGYPNASNNLRMTVNPRKFVASGTEMLPEVSAVLGDDAHGTSEYAAAGKKDDSSSTTLKSMISNIFKLEQQERAEDHMQPKKGQKMTNASKRRAKPSDVQKPRPRDRQLIQDRVKELRELVPNGAKCSIDGLLDRTVKHMLYLRGVTDQAAKLKQLMYQKVDSNAWKSSEEKVDSQSGTSWAFEFGNANQVCPILVEDLPSPGHMLIEMLCNEQGLFLEIAQVIRGLELTILKGIMESRSDTTWAHFIVEASKGFHRLDIFWPLMQLLQRKKNSLSSKI